MASLGRLLMLTGGLMLVVGLLLTLAPQIPLLGKLPGDLQIERGGLRITFPITTCLLLSLALTLLLNLFSKLR